jgi:hypothetical protein
LAFHPPAPPLLSATRLADHRKTEKERQVAAGLEGGGGGAETYDRKKAWSSINRSTLCVILYVHPPILHPLPLPLTPPPFPDSYEGNPIKGIVCYMENPSIPEIQNKFLQYPPLLSFKKEVMTTR